jgi:hypothetical protein
MELEHLPAAEPGPQAQRVVLRVTLPEPWVFQGLALQLPRMRRVAKRPVRKGLVPRRSKLRRR